MVNGTSLHYNKRINQGHYGGNVNNGIIEQ